MQPCFTRTGVLSNRTLKKDVSAECPLSTVTVNSQLVTRRSQYVTGVTARATPREAGTKMTYRATHIAPRPPQSSATTKMSREHLSHRSGVSRALFGKTFGFPGVSPVVGAHAHAHALHPCTVCPRACRDKGSRVLGSWACKFTRLESRRLRSRTRNGRVHASAGLRGHQLRLFESCGCLKRPLAPTTLPHCHGTALQKEAAYRDDRTSKHAPQRRHMAALPFCNGSSAIPLTSHDVLNQTHRFRGSYV